MIESDFSKHYPQLYHIATGGSWASSPTNSGSTLHTPPSRGANTFVSLKECAFKDWYRRRKKRPEEVIAEIVVPYRIEEIESFVDKVESYSGSQRTGVLWEA